MNIIELIKKSISNICTKYIEDSYDNEEIILPIF